MILLTILFSIWLHWTAPGDDGMVGQAHHYELRMAQVPPQAPLTMANFQAVRQIDTPPPSPAGQPDSALVTGLVEGYTYHFRIRTFDEAGNVSPLSNELILTVRDTIPPAVIDNLDR